MPFPVSSHCLLVTSRDVSCQPPLQCCTCLAAAMLPPWWPWILTLWNSLISWFWMELAISQHFYYELHFPLNLKVFVFYFGTPKGNFRQWETQLHQSPGPCRCLHWVHAHHHWETDSSNPPPQTLDHYSLKDRGLSFLNCLGLESEQNLHHPGRGSWMGRTSCSHCNPEECWLCCCLR